MPIPAQCDGKSLRPLLEDPAVRVRDYAFSYYGVGEKVPGHYALRGERWAYMYYGPGAEELYDMDADPGQFTNLATDPAHAEVMEELRAALAKKRAALEASPAVS